MVSSYGVLYSTIMLVTSFHALLNELIIFAGSHSFLMSVNIIKDHRLAVLNAQRKTLIMLFNTGNSMARLSDLFSQIFR